MKIQKYFFLLAITLLCASAQSTEFELIAKLILNGKIERKYYDSTQDSKDSRFSINMNPESVQCWGTICLVNEKPYVNLFLALDLHKAWGAKSTREIDWEKLYFMELKDGKDTARLELRVRKLAEAERAEKL